MFTIQQSSVTQEISVVLTIIFINEFDQTSKPGLPIKAGEDFCTRLRCVWESTIQPESAILEEDLKLMEVHEGHNAFSL
jgi:hypothetical protein